MRHFLIIFDRRRQELLLEKEFADRADALRARFAAEREGYSEDVEIVALNCESPELMRRTHARYFMSMGEMVRNNAWFAATL